MLGAPPGAALPSIDVDPAKDAALQPVSIHQNLEDILRTPTMKLVGSDDGRGPAEATISPAKSVKITTQA